MHDSEARFRSIFSASPLALALCDPECLIIDFNQSFSDLFGILEPWEIKNHTLFLEVYLSDTQKIELKEHRVVHFELLYDFEKNRHNQLFKTLRSGTVNLDVLFSPFHWQRGSEASGYLLQIADITERKLTEEGLLENEAKYRTVFESSAVGFFLLSDVFIDCNAEAQRLWNCARPDIIGRTPLDFSPEIQPGGRLSSERMAEYMQNARNGAPQVFYWKFQRPDGVSTDTELSLKLIYVSGVPLVLAAMRDITEQKNAETAYRHALSRFEAIIENTPRVAIQGYTRDGVIRHWNKASEMFYGLSAQDVLGKRMQDTLFAGLDPVEFNLTLEQIWTTGQPSVPQEWELPKPGFPNIWVYSSMFPIFEHTEVVEVFCMDVEITELKKTESALRYSEEKYRTTFENSGNALIIINADMSIALVNRELEKISGFTREELEGKRKWPEFVAHREDLEKMTEYHRQRRAHAENIPQTYESQFLDKNRKIHDVMLTVTLLPSTNQSLVAFTDISEKKKAERYLKKSEEQYRLLAENVKDVIWTIDIHGRLTYVSPSVFLLTGYTVEEALKHSPEDIFMPESAKKIRALQTLDDPNHPGWRQPIEVEQKCKNGASLWTEISMAPMQGSEGNIIGCVGVTRDISARRAAEAERRQLEEQLQQSQKMEVIGHLAGGIAHDFNNLLTPILGYADMAAMQVPPGSPIYNDIKAIQETAERAAKLTRQLLAFSLKQVLHMTAVNLNDEIREFMKMLHPLIGEHIELQTHLAPGLGLIKGDLSQIQQVLMNLAVNARDAMPHGGTLTFSTANAQVDDGQAKPHPHLKPGAYVRVTVKDTGTGMNHELLEHIFEPFFTTKERGKGTGLGLSMVYGIILQHQGVIWGASEPGQGAAFELYFPKLETPITAPADFPDASETQIPGRGTILVVEDEPMVRKLANEILSSQGYTIIPASGPEQALEQLVNYTGPLDLLLTDIIMPGLNGKELYQRLVEQRPLLRVLYMSGYSEDIIAHHGVLDPNIQLLAKPFAVKALLKKVREVLEQEPFTA